jgi:ABC-type transporter Mla MlaB component
MAFYFYYLRWRNDCVECSECTRRGAQCSASSRKANGEIVFKVSGQLDAENVAEIASVIGAEEKGSRIVLDLADLRSVDCEAVKFLEKSEEQAVELKNCGAYIREWIRRERLERELERRTKK